MSEVPFDARNVANLMLDDADRVGINITNLALQKLLYFAHGMFLIETKHPLVSGFFEAWQHGPVHPAAYRAFRSAGSEPIRFRAQSEDVLTGGSRPIPEPGNPAVRRLVKHLVRSYGRLSPGRLVDIAHAKNSPWHFIADKSRTSVAFSIALRRIQTFSAGLRTSSRSRWVRGSASYIGCRRVLGWHSSPISLG